MVNVPPSVRRTMNAKLTRKENDALAPPFKRISEVNRDADKNKRIGKRK